MAGQAYLYKAEAADQLLVEPLDAMTLIFHRRSGITHMVAEPVPEILSAMASDTVDAATLVQRLMAQFDLGSVDDAVTVISARLEELADLGLVVRVKAHA